VLLPKIETLSGGNTSMVVPRTGELLGCRGWAVTDSKGRVLQ
jgi:hypothetical protein